MSTSQCDRFLFIYLPRAEDCTRLPCHSSHERATPHTREYIYRRSDELQHVEIAAIVQLLEQKGLCTKQDLTDIITELRQKNPHAKIPETAFPEPYLLSETENEIIDNILALLNKNGLTSHQSLNLLERLGKIIEMGQRVAKGTTH